MPTAPRPTIRTALRRGITALAVAASVAAASVISPKSPVAPLPQAAAAISCDTATGGTKFYPGDDSSRTYNDTFWQGRSIDHYLNDYVPQGLAYWPNWKGSDDIVLVGMHHEAENSHHSLLYGLDANGNRVGTVYLPVGAHAGSVKIYRGWMYVQQDNDMIRRYRLSYVREQFGKPGIPSLGLGTPIAIGAIDVSFFDIFDGKLYAGHFNADNRDWMVRYTINSDTGALSRDRAWGRVQVPKRSQGLNVTASTFYFSTSSGRNDRSNIYVIRRGYGSNIENRRYRCFRAPVLSQDIERMGGVLLLSFEGGADYFDGNWPWTTADNKIKNLHVASLDRLHDMVW